MGRLSWHMSQSTGIHRVIPLFGFYWISLMKIHRFRQFGGNPNYGEQPTYCRNGSVWSKYRAVWHMDGEDPTLVRDSSKSYHATPHNFEELRVGGVIGKAVNFDGVNDYLELPLDSHPLLAVSI